MSRSSTDLLDFFGKRSGKAQGARAVSRPVAGARAPVVAWSGRQAALAGATALLLLALAFVGGVAVGQGRKPAADGKVALVRGAGEPERDVWMLRGRPLMRIQNGAVDNYEIRALAAFRSRFPDLVPFLSATGVEDGRGRMVPGQFRLVIRGFQSEASATAWAKVLATATVGEHQPFKDCRPEKAPR